MSATAATPWRYEAKMSDTPTDYTDKVRKLLALAEDAGATEAEREAFRAKAYELMAREQITEAMIRNAGSAPEDITCFEHKFDNPWGNERMNLICNVARAFGCKPIVSKWGSKPKGFVTICGVRRDLEACQLTLTSIDLQLPFAVKQFKDVPSYLTPWEKFVERRTYVEGWGAGVVTQIRSAAKATRETVVAEAAAASGEDVTAINDRVSLVLQDAGRATQDFIDKKFGKLGKLRGGSKVMGSSYGAGHSAGSKANVGGGSRSFNAGPKGIGSGK